MPFRPVVGDLVPVQQSAVTCGAAALTVARMMANPALAAWLSQDPQPPSRFAAYERRVHARTTALRGPTGRLEPPWPRALGTPPWGAARELELHIAPVGTAYRVRWIRRADSPTLTGTFARLSAGAALGYPSLIYLGSALLPRHVVLVAGRAEPRTLAVYNPSSDRVLSLAADRFRSGRFQIAGWDTLWCVVEPRVTPHAGTS